MAGPYEHLSLPRIEIVTPRRRGAAVPPGPQLEPRGHARNLQGQLMRAVSGAQAAEPGFDGRALLTLKLAGKPPDELVRSFPGMELVADEGRDGDGYRVVVVFATRAARDEFARRLALMQRGQRPTAQDLLLAVRGIESWTPADRTAPSLLRALDDWKAGDLAARHRLDVELFPLDDDVSARRRMVETFADRCAGVGVAVLDRVVQAVVLLRVAATVDGIRWLLRYTDVRTVDLPPRFQLDPVLHRLALTDLVVEPGVPGAPRVAVLDTGVVANHPLLQGAIGHAESFLKGSDAADDHGHGTTVAGLVVYGDVEACAERRRFRPEVTLLSGRVLDGANEYQDELIEAQVRRAVTEFRGRYGCRIFNLSLGDEEHPYDDRRLRPFAATLDAIAREEDVLFVVSTGNQQRGTGRDWRRGYPRYLLEDDARILDPAPALNVLTVGSVARFEATRLSAGNPDTVEHAPVARAGEPSPFTRAGPSLGGAVKPELVAHGGNWATNPRDAGGRPVGAADLGVLTTAREFAGGNLFAVDSGTSYAAPQVANLAARVLGARPDASASLVRALLVAHADADADSLGRLADDDARLRLLGYGVPHRERTLRSLDHSVTLVREDEIGENETHFYEIPLPADFFSGAPRRRRRIRVVVAHAPLTRATRFEYRGSKLKLRIPRSDDIDQVVATFRRTSREEREDNIPEPAGVWPGKKVRDAGTVQVATWDVSQVDGRWGDRARYAVVERVVPDWAKERVERERYAIVVVIEERERTDVQYYAQIRARVEQRIRVRART